MNVTVTVDMTYHPTAIEVLKRSEGTRAAIERKTTRLANALRSAAPVESGAARASIQSRLTLGPDGWVGSASWDEQHYYLGILHSRTHWAESVVQGIRYI